MLQLGAKHHLDFNDSNASRWAKTVAGKLFEKPSILKAQYVTTACQSESDRAQVIDSLAENLPALKRRELAEVIL